MLGVAKRVGYFLGLIVALGALWLGLSGHYTTLVMSLGAVSILITAIMAYRFDILDRDGSPYGRLFQLMAYWVWLVIEIFKANWVVIKACIRADLDINPALVKVKTRGKSDMAKTVFANSITLTPGTISVTIEDDKILVHALYEQYAQPEDFLEMDRRSSEASDGKAKA